MRPQLARPKVTIYTAAPPARIRLAWNRYYRGQPGQQTIGAALQIGHRVIGIRWARPRVVTPYQQARLVIEEATRAAAKETRRCP